MKIALEECVLKTGSQTLFFSFVYYFEVTAVHTFPDSLLFAVPRSPFLVLVTFTEQASLITKDW